MTGYFLTEQDILLQKTVREFANNQLTPNAGHYDQNAEFPWENFQSLAELGLFGLTIDEDFGGTGGTALQSAIVVEELSRGCAATAVIYIAHLSLCTRLINLFGSIDLKKKILPSMVAGEKIGAFALTEPNSGSDSAALSTTATKDGADYILSGTKHFITNAGEADIFVIMATLDRNMRSRGINAFVVEKNTPGITVTKQQGKMGLRASSTAEINFEGCRVPEGNMLGSKGQGFKQAMGALNISRIEVAAQALGIAQSAYESAVNYSQKRQAFGQNISDFQGIQWMLVEMATNIEAARHLVYNAASLSDKGLSFVKEASMAKLFASRIAVETADKAVQIHGGTGYFAPTAVERNYRDAKVTEIYEGSSEIQRLIIARNILGF
ncbi:MAG: acyl-CoA dehydrogenase family protein [Chloroflexota bacterium]|nr:acyl-CoA dehydrogenase family protein [Chloroflexota bacterium]